MKSNPKIKIKFNMEVAEIAGKDKVEKIKFKDGTVMEVDGVFVAIGHKPASKILRGRLIWMKKIILSARARNISPCLM